MTKQEFINSIKEVVLKDSINSVESSLIRPPGLAPVEKLVILSKWFNRQLISLHLFCRILVSG